MMLPPPPRATKWAQRLLRTHHGAIEIDIDDAAIGFDVERLTRRFPLETGIVDETSRGASSAKRMVSNIAAMSCPVADIGLDHEMVEPAMAAVARPPSARGRASPPPPSGLPKCHIDGDGRAFPGRAGRQRHGRCLGEAPVTSAYWPTRREGTGA